MLRRSLGLLVLWMLFVMPLLAQDIPPSLQDWQGWVLHDEPQHSCPFLANQMPDADSYQCAWLGRLNLDATAEGAHFQLTVHVDASSWIVLPGDARNWPQLVSINRQAATVLQRQNAPTLWLTPGDYEISGMLPWSTRPAQLRVPASLGLITLNVDGAPVTRIERNGDQLTLGEAAATQKSADALSLRIYRLLNDGLPATLETQIQLNVAGSAREQVLGPVLPPGFVATALVGDLPARLDSDGRMRVQLRPGQWTLTLSARDVEPLVKVALKLPPAPWPKQEIWSYGDNTDLRSTRVEGRPIDSAQAGVPEAWTQLPAFELDHQNGLSVLQGNRGDEGGRGDQLHLQRQMWLDFDGRGLSVADHLTGELRHHQRLDVAGPWQLQRASQDDEPLLITAAGKNGSGVELRDRQISLDAGLRLPVHAGALPSTGWQLPLNGIDATLHLPGGYRLLGAIGADRSPDSWAGQWTLLDLFVVALIALLAGRLLGWPWAVLAAAYLALAQHEQSAPLWTLAAVLALALLLRALPQGRLRSAARTLTLVVFAFTALWTLPFVTTQLQYALHPQLEGRSLSFVPEELLIGTAKSNNPEMRAMRNAPLQQSPKAFAPPPPAPPAPPTVMDASTAVTANLSSASEASRATVDAVSSSLAQASSAVITGHDTDNRTVIQAGAGTPHWNDGNNYRLGWSGPVTVDQMTRLLIAPSWLVRVLRVLMVGMLVVLLGKLMQTLSKAWPQRWINWRKGRVVSTALLAFALLPHAIHAQAMPSQQMLDQLRTRLTEAPKCAPTCAELAQVQLHASADGLDLQLEAHTGASVALPLPQNDDGLQLIDINLDGKAAAALSRQNGQLLLRLERGVHQITLRYRLGAVDSTTLQFPLHPQHVAFAGQGWTLDGVDDGRALGDSLVLHRTQVAGDGKDLLATQSFPPYVRLIRKLQFGLDWTVENTVQRIAPLDGGFSISLPLLPGEHPQGDGLVVKDGRINITFNANNSAVQWTSRLDQSKQLALHAPELGQRAEVWQIYAAPMWHVDATGVPTSEGDQALTYQPLPGETLKLALTRPMAIAGDSLAFDGVGLNSHVGERATDTTLTLQARSTRGGEHSITLPVGAELLSATRDNIAINLAMRDGKLSLPLLPGDHVYILQLREPHGVTTATRSSPLALHAPVANIDLAMHLPQDRWVLWTWGPSHGPAVLYWSQLIVLLLVAWLLARFAPTPLRFHHWLLLGLGFSAFSWSSYALVVLWLILLGLRARHAPSPELGATKFNLLQVGLVGISLLAVAVLIAAVPKGLLGLPDMHVAGNDSSAWHLNWFADQSSGDLPVAGLFSVSLWVYKIAMLAWALWLANALIDWMRWGFEAWMLGGYWRKKREPKQGVTPPPLQPTTIVETPPDA